MGAAVSSGAIGYSIHLTGPTSIPEAQVSRLGAHSLNASVLKHHSRLILMQALVSRKAILGGQAALTNHLSFERGTIEALLILALQVPLVLDSTDLLRSEQPRNRAVVFSSEVYGMAVCLDRAFNNWFVDYELRQTKLRRRPCDFHSFLGANALSLLVLEAAFIGVHRVS